MIPQDFRTRSTIEQQFMRKADRCEWERPSRLYVQRENSPATGILNGLIGTFAAAGILVGLWGALFW